jgi:hypothetical protein
VTKKFLELLPRILAEFRDKLVNCKDKDDQRAIKNSITYYKLEKDKCDVIQYRCKQMFGHFKKYSQLHHDFNMNELRLERLDQTDVEDYNEMKQQSAVSNGDSTAVQSSSSIETPTNAGTYAPTVSTGKAASNGDSTLHTKARNSSENSKQQQQSLLNSSSSSRLVQSSSSSMGTPMNAGTYAIVTAHKTNERYKRKWSGSSDDDADNNKSSTTTNLCDNSLDNKKHIKADLLYLDNNGTAARNEKAAKALKASELTLNDEMLTMEHIFRNKCNDVLFYGLPNSKAIKLYPWIDGGTSPIIAWKDNALQNTQQSQSTFTWKPNLSDRIDVFFNVDRSITTKSCLGSVTESVLDHMHLYICATAQIRQPEGLSKAKKSALFDTYVIYNIQKKIISIERLVIYESHILQSICAARQTDTNCNSTTVLTTVQFLVDYLYALLNQTNFTVNVNLCREDYPDNADVKLISSAFNGVLARNKNKAEASKALNDKMLSMDHIFQSHCEGVFFSNKQIGKAIKLYPWIDGGISPIIAWKDNTLQNTQQSQSTLTWLNNNPLPNLSDSIDVLFKVDRYIDRDRIHLYICATAPQIQKIAFFNTYAVYNIHTKIIIIENFMVYENHILQSICAARGTDTNYNTTTVLTAVRFLVIYLYELLNQANFTFEINLQKKDYPDDAVVYFIDSIFKKCVKKICV